MAKRNKEIKPEDPKVEDPKPEDPKVENPKPEKESKGSKISNSREVELLVLVAFTDKYTHEDYAVNDTIKVEPDRAEELLKDSRKLVKKA